MKQVAEQCYVSTIIYWLQLHIFTVGYISKTLLSDTKLKTRIPVICLNFHPVVSHYGDPELQVGENYSYLEPAYGRYPIY